MKESSKSIFSVFPELEFVSPDMGNATERSIHSYVIRTNKLHTFQLDAVKNYYPHYGLSYQKGPIDFQEIFHNDHPVVMEIGFGMGTSTSRIAKERPEFNYIGVEVFLNGFTKLLDTVGKEALENVRLMRFDAVRVLSDMIADNSLAGFHIFFPDPWPKKRQQKRRLIQKDFANLLCKKLCSHGYIYCATDWEEYAEQMVDVFAQTKGLHNPYEKFAPSRQWRPTTKYEQRGMNLSYKIKEVWFEKD